MTALPAGAENSISLDKPPLVSFQSFPFVQRPSFHLRHYELFSMMRSRSLDPLSAHQRSGEHSVSSRLLPSSQRPRRGYDSSKPRALVTPQSCQSPGRSQRSETVVGIIGPTQHRKPSIYQVSIKYLPRKELKHRGTPSGKASKPYRVESSREWISGISQPGA